MTTLKETINKLTKLYSDLNDCNDGFTCSMIINDIEIAVKQYATESIKASLEKAELRFDFLKYQMDDKLTQEKISESITNPENIVLL